ncbi:phosphoribosyl-ATP diphosphatase [bacterium]|nr:phosphoribosyl-ATP diphosphatase [bacterium]MDA7924027.1 phosphoribosyl-ATP diphosphatase [Mariniblastus sp.]MDA7901531.1 phosphoribosyl-ATP diphosphatase [bacterium]MDA7904639.1 phosphoribosyl-ATP diphosphatase [bacterium]MDB4357511.1 phosphoribosyl-ATP diphosphatase [Mariniblastus sp.]
MIIPQIKYPSVDSPQQLIQTIKQWSLFGQIAITGIDANAIDEVKSILRKLGGTVDISIEFDSLDAEGKLAMLNEGACHLLNRGSSSDSEIVPPDRQIGIIDNPPLDQAIPKNTWVALDSPSAPRISELEMARIDCLVDIVDLSPELITNFFKTVLVTDRPDGLWSTVIVDPIGIALGLAYSNHESLLHAIETRCGTYWSRSRDDLWIKGETSGATQQLLGIRMDCDRDCLRFTVTQDSPGFCHRNTHTCFGQERTIQSVVERLQQRLAEADESSFTHRLANQPEMLEAKLLEEAKELSLASQSTDQDEIAWEAADVLYFSLIAMLKNGVSLDRVYAELARRMNRVVRRDPGLKT